MDNLIKIELFKNLDSFVNEISLTMDYISPELIKRIEVFIVKLKKEQCPYKIFNEFINCTNEHLCKFEVKFSGALFSNKKVKTSYYDFLNEIKLFSKDATLEFKLFKDESKATKKQFVSYLYNIYQSCVFFKLDKTLDETELSKELKDFIEKIKKESETAVTTEYEKVEKSIPRRNAISGPSIQPLLTPNVIPELGQLPGLESMMSGMGGGMGGFGGIMSSILGNKEILNIASDISNQMSNQQLDPMAMLTSLMSGNIENSPLSSLVTQIQQKVEMKIESGDINRNELENQAQNIMNNIDPAQFSSLPGMSSMMQSMAENLQKQQEQEHQEEVD